jgi:phosphatidylserine decarboxylase
MGIHKEGYVIILIVFAVLLLINLGIFFLTKQNFSFVIYLTSIASLLFLLFVVHFFRVPDRPTVFDENCVYAPADGTICAIEETEEGEYFKDKRLQVSIFMSVWNVHINWFPYSGQVKYYKYHPGKFLVANLPKASTDNERTSVVLSNNEGKELLIRQIAGFVARRIVCYAVEGKNIKQGDELGFIKFGSRVDLFFPIGTKIDLKLGDKVTGKRTVIARFK